MIGKQSSQGSDHDLQKNYTPLPAQSPSCKETDVWLAFPPDHCGPAEALGAQTAPAGSSPCSHRHMTIWVHGEEHVY